MIFKFIYFKKKKKGQHGSTFGGNPLAAKVAMTALQGSITFLFDSQKSFESIF